MVIYTEHVKQAIVQLTMCVYVNHHSQEWTKLEKPEGAPWPVERSAHAACCLNYGEEHPQLLVTGGVDKNYTTLQDVWILDVNSRRWREVSGDVYGFPVKIRALSTDSPQT